MIFRTLKMNDPSAKGAYCDGAFAMQSDIPAPNGEIRVVSVDREWRWDDLCPDSSGFTEYARRFHELVAEHECQRPR